MKICRYLMRQASSSDSASPRYGLIEGENVIEISAPPWAPWSRGSRSSRLAEVRLLAPVEPSKIVCIGRNYAAHAAEMGKEVPKEPLMFLKPPSSIIGPEEAIVLTKYSQRVEHEGELALVIGRRCSQLRDTDDALSWVMGYSCLNDVTARDLQKSDVQFTRAKGFDTFCAVGPHIETALDASNVLVETHVNGTRRQSGVTSLMTYAPAFLVRWISRMMTLMPGDVIATGTPAGVGPLVAGDTVEVSVAGIGVLRNPVHAPQA
ncbi:MAG: 2-hydroxyhepta-2,4-diene-1,7-dioate isomerase [Acidobacteria bacterium]|nr:MAG: 2-hydroxyhepta-2,4-diene-1,7-dioate isomerase [Acidobacteriota bacterium]PYU44907.1 MAG: 2-hydroxyhepta-2,4-diene-1,7-dioate isomerase [Acidobacteriota bacterium]